MDYYKTKEKRLAELLTVVGSCLLGRVTLDECAKDLEELAAMGRDFKHQRNDRELQLLGVRLMQFTHEFQRGSKAKNKRLVRLSTAIRKSIERLEGRLRDGDGSDGN